MGIGCLEGLFCYAWFWMCLLRVGCVGMVVYCGLACGGGFVRLRVGVLHVIASWMFLIGLFNFVVLVCFVAYLW